MSNRLASVVFAPENNSSEISRKSIPSRSEMSKSSESKSRSKSKSDGDSAGVDKATSSADAENRDHDAQDWRDQIRVEVRAAMTDLLAQRESVVQAGPFEIEEDDVMDSGAMADLVKKMQAENRSNKTAIRLAAITKDGNKQHFLDMIEIKEKLEEAAAALKESKKKKKREREKKYEKENIYI